MMTKQHRLTAQQREYRKFLRSVEWMLQRSRIVLRSGGLCELCHKRRLKQIHHLRYSEPIDATPDSDLVAVCGYCHRSQHIKFPGPGALAASEMQLF